MDLTRIRLTNIERRKDERTAELIEIVLKTRVAFDSAKAQQFAVNSGVSMQLLAEVFARSSVRQH